MGPTGNPDSGARLRTSHLHDPQECPLPEGQPCHGAADGRPGDDVKLERLRVASARRLGGRGVVENGPYVEGVGGDHAYPSVGPLGRLRTIVRPPVEFEGA